MKRSRLLARSLPLCIVALGPAPTAVAQNRSADSDKIALMADALRARRAGDLVLAEEKLRSLVEIAPEDANVQRLLAQVSAELGPTSPPPEPGPDAEFGESFVAGILPERPPSAALLDRASRALRSGEESPLAGFLAEQEVLEELLARGRAQFIAGDFEGARETFASVEARAPNNAEAKSFQAEMARQQRLTGGLNREKTREQMLQEVAQSWQRPQIFDRELNTRAIDEDDTLQQKLEAIVLPQVSFSALPLSRTVDTLSALSAEYDPEGRGVNMVLIDPGGLDPEVKVTLRRLSLARVLDFVTESVGYEYDVQSDAVVVRQGQGAGSRLETEFFPISRSTIIRLTGVGAGREGGARAGPTDPFAAVSTASEGRPESGEEEALKHFLQRAGVPFETIEGANLALADGQLIVTQSARNMDRVRNILRRYTEVKQVEIEARFLEVRQSDLEELGFDWSVNLYGRNKVYPSGHPLAGNPQIGEDGRPLQFHEQSYATPARTLAEAFGMSRSASTLSITSSDTIDEAGNPVEGLDVSLPVLAPAIPNTLDLGAGASRLASISGVIGDAEVDLIIRALERRTGNDLMSAPKVTVLSGKTAEITVGQELRYPESYGDIEAQVGRGDSSGSGSAGVAITAGTPRDFVVRNVGVEMEVTPTVEDDNSISLLLEPRVTEFEGFVEYGGTSVAIASSTTVTVPSGFFQPIFSVRRVRTEVTIWDGATVVMGGLTRDQSVSVADKVPVLGDIPLLGRLFRSGGESSEKRNLLIFVSANLISPGGSPQRQQFRTVDPGSLFQNPTIVTPGGAVNRGALPGDD
ncbi:MAG: hypothetical protein ACOC3I_08670 [Verrucomicrobiota bacterium]